jgi:hypothetical protein
MTDPMITHAEATESGLSNMSCHNPVLESNTMDTGNGDIGILNSNPYMSFSDFFPDDQPDPLLTSNSSMSFSISDLLHEDDGIEDSTSSFSVSIELSSTSNPKRTFAGIS